MHADAISTGHLAHLDWFIQALRKCKKQLVLELGRVPDEVVWQCKWVDE